MDNKEMPTVKNKAHRDLMLEITTLLKDADMPPLEAVEMLETMIYVMKDVFGRSNETKH